MSIHNIGPIQRPPQARTSRPGFFIDYSQFQTMVHYEFREALYQIQHKQGPWEIMCFHADAFGRDVVYLRGDGRVPKVRLCINEADKDYPTRHSAYIALTEQLPHCMQPDWHWVFLPDSVVAAAVLKQRLMEVK